MDKGLKITLLVICIILFIFTTFINIRLKKSLLDTDQSQKKTSLYMSLLSIVIIVLTIITIILLKTK